MALLLRCLCLIEQQEGRLENGGNTGATSRQVSKSATANKRQLCCCSARCCAAVVEPLMYCTCLRHVHLCVSTQMHTVDRPTADSTSSKMLLIHVMILELQSHYHSLPSVAVHIMVLEVVKEKEAEFVQSAGRVGAPRTLLARRMLLTAAQRCESHQSSNRGHCTCTAV